LQQSKDSFKCSARQLALASPPSNSNDTPRMDADMASSMAGTTAVATVVATMAVAATAMAVAATAAEAAAATQTVVVVATAAQQQWQLRTSDPKQPLTSEAVQELELLFHPWQQPQKQPHQHNLCLPK
jgi:hypothetical protein